MTGPCAVCGSAVEVVYESSSGQALTSLCTLLDQPTVVAACPTCGHLQTPPIGDLDAYYATAYRILLASEEEDQIYAVTDGRIEYRAERQAAGFLATVPLPADARVLDYGAAKGATMRRVRAERPDVQLHFFDVSDMYVDHWRTLVADDAFATFEAPAAWTGSFDVVSSFFMLEHVAQPTEVVAAMADLVRPGGTIYAIVPDPFVNVGDFVVVDHTNHFTRPALERLFTDAGFEAVTVDGDAYAGAWVVDARKPASGATPAPGGATSPVAVALERARELAGYWSSAHARVVAAEQAARGPLAIYGAGFYGSFVRANLAHPDAVVAYVDQNPHLIGTEHDGRPVVAPADLGAEVTDVVVGLNPLHARSIVADIEAWHGRDLGLHFL